ncbi:MAG: polyamine ABC transporter substrate-binding protein [Bauldia sp.]|nr:polyamine ABC transporter substrate-binding protein [Bauldia sp.]
MPHCLARLPLAAAILAGTSAFALAQDRVVNVYNWSDYIEESVLAEFTAETGIRVVYDVYDNNEIVETKLLAGGSGYDLAVPSDANVMRLIQAGALQPLDKSLIPNLANMWPAITDRLAAYDPGNEYAVNYMWGTTGIGYNVAMVAERLGDAPEDSWALVLDPAIASKFADCGIQVLDQPDEMIHAALAYLGIDPGSTDPDDIRRAGDAWKAVRPYIQKFHSSEYINALANGDICLAVGFSGDILQARDRAAEAGAGVEVAYAIPQEGAQMWFDSFVIPRDAPHVAEAHAFIDFMMRPEVAAANSNYVYYANGNLASQSLLNDDVISDTAIYPDLATVERLFTALPYDPRTQRVVTGVWTEVKSGG